MNKTKSSTVQHTWHNAPNLLDFDEVSNITNLSKKKIVEQLKQGLFPAPCGSGSSVWFKADISAYIAAQYDRNRPINQPRTGQSLRRVKLSKALYERTATKYGKPTYFFTIQLAAAQPTSDFDIKKWNDKKLSDLRKILKYVPQDVFDKPMQRKYNPLQDFRYLMAAENRSADGSRIVTWHLHGVLFLTEEEKTIIVKRCEIIKRRVKQTLRNHAFHFNMKVIEPNDEQVIRYALKHIDHDPTLVVGNAIP